VHDPRKRPSTKDGSQTQTESVRRQTPLATANEQAPPSGRGFAAQARNQLVLREVNEQIADLTGEWTETGERIRADEANFVVFPGHEQPVLERVVDRHSRFVVVATREPVGGSAHAADPLPR
jgi:hypothetical protein